MDVVTTEGLSRFYGRRVGIEDVSLRVPEGSIYGFLGPNGSGKTTTIRLLLGFLRPSHGGARVFGLDAWRDSPRIKADTGYVPGDLRLWSWMRGRDAISFVGRTRRDRSVETRGRELAERFELELDVTVRNMSRGMRQKLGLVLALAHDPRLLVLDEPTSGLDPLTQERLNRTLRESAARGTTVFFSSHVLAEVEDLCDRVAIIRGGHVVADEPLAELRSRAARVVTVRWADGVTPPSPPPFLNVEDPSAHVWSARLGGPVTPLLEWLRGREIDDLSIRPPDLDSLFMEYYRS